MTGKLFLGNVEVEKAYLGNVCVYEKSTQQNAKWLIMEDMDYYDELTSIEQEYEVWDFWNDQLGRQGYDPDTPIVDDATYAAAMAQCGQYMGCKIAYYDDWVLEYEGVDYYAWTFVETDSNYWYGYIYLTTTIDYDELQAYALVTDTNNRTSPIVYVLQYDYSQYSDNPGGWLTLVTACTADNPPISSN